MLMAVGLRRNMWHPGFSVSWRKLVAGKVVWDKPGFGIRAGGRLEISSVPIRIESDRIYASTYVSLLIIPAFEIEAGESSCA
jgi:hypothetical protein